MTGNEQKQIKQNLNKITGILNKLIEEKEKDIANHRKLNELFNEVHANFKPGRMSKLDLIRLQTKFINIEVLSRSIPGTVDRQGHLYAQYNKISQEIMNLAGAV